MSDGSVDVSDALEQLVNQFADRLSFFRELVQNSIDAGTNEIEITTGWEGRRDGSGLATIQVHDFGAGMDREIIDTKLTRLFSSGKDGDLTKIGRFGIGFVSVFAIEPDAVCVDTSRAGETWRVLFRKDKTFRRIALDEPVDGTRIRIFKSMDEPDFDRFVADSRRTIDYWCKHVPVDVFFDGERINRPMDVPGPCKIRLERGDTVVVASYTPHTAGRFGFYNAGLTLLEGEGDFHPGLAFKASSRKLEHTMTRDNVIRDDAFERVMSVVDDARSALQAKLLEMLEAHVQDDSHADQAPELYGFAARADFPTHTPDAGQLARKIFRDTGGRLHSLREAQQAARRGFFAVRRNTPLAEAVAAAGPLVLLGAEQSAAAARWLGREPDPLRRHYCLARPVDASDTEIGGGWAAVGSLTHELVQSQVGARIFDTVLARFGTDAEGRADLACAFVRELGTPEERQAATTIPTGLLARRRRLALNLDHQTVRRAIALGPAAPAFAAYVLARLVVLTCDGAEPDHERLCTRALESRWEPTTT